MDQSPIPRRRRTTLGLCWVLCRERKNDTEEIRRLLENNFVRRIDQSK
jgi:hypothetical protein